MGLGQACREAPASVTVAAALGLSGVSCPRGLCAQPCTAACAWPLSKARVWVGPTVAPLLALAPRDGRVTHGPCGGHASHAPGAARSPRQVVGAGGEGVESGCRSQGPICRVKCIMYRGRLLQSAPLWPAGGGRWDIYTGAAPTCPRGSKAAFIIICRAASLCLVVSPFRSRAICQCRAALPLLGQALVTITATGRVSARTAEPPSSRRCAQCWPS